MPMNNTLTLENMLLLTNTTKLLLCRTPILLLGVVGMPLFEGANATKYLDRFDNLYKEYYVTNKNKLNKLSCYYSRNIGDAIKSFKEQEQKDYLGLWKAILIEYKNNNSYQQIYSLQFLEKYKLVVRTKKNDMS